MSKTHPEGVELDEVEPRKTRGPGLLVGLSAALAVVATGAAILGFVGRTLYVTRDEYTSHTVVNVEDKAVFQQTMRRVEDLLSRQESAFEKLSDTVQTLRIQVAGQQRGR